MPFLIGMKIIICFLVLTTSPGKIKRDAKVEKYIQTNRKDLTALKKTTPLNITPPLRSGYCSETNSLYARYEGFSYLFMKPIAANNAAVFYLFYL